MAPDAPPSHRNAAALFGLGLVLVVVKFGNPVILTHQPDGQGALTDLLRPPSNVYEYLLTSWPVPWSYGALGLLALAGLFVWRWRLPRPAWLIGSSLLWFGWQLFSAVQTVDASLTQSTVLHFAGCLVCLWLGLFALSELRDLRPIWWGLGAALTIVLWTALAQHFGGFAMARAEFERLVAEGRAVATPEFRTKLASERVFGTFVYPNALAGGILLLLPAALTGLWIRGANLWLRRSLAGILAAAAAAALYWSGSKSGWLIALALGVLALVHAPLKPVLKYSLLGALLAAGVLAFLGRHSGYFEKGATSLAARRDYWQAARHMMAARPLLGYGPGTFQIPYRAMKSPEAEMAKLAHNDYLQQGCDAGLPALLAYVVFIAGSLFWLRPRRLRVGPSATPDTKHAAISPARSGSNAMDGQRFAVWLGALGFAVQGVVEFGLYIPALAWPFFLFLGWLWGTKQATGTAPEIASG